MEVKILEDSKNKLVVELPGRGHTLCNPLKRELWNNKNVKTATYTINHPLVGLPKLVVETNGSETPRDAILKAIASLGKQSQQMSAEASKIR